MTKLTSVTVREIKSNEYDNWDQLVSNSPQGTIFHAINWLVACAESLQKELKIYGCFENGKIVAGCQRTPNTEL